MNRNIAVCVVASIFTCGIFSLVWFFMIADDVYRMTPELKNPVNAMGTTPGVSLLLTILTCGIYGIYAFYKWAQALHDIGSTRGVLIEDRSIIYILLAVFGFSIINYALIQADLNALDAKTIQIQY